MKLPDLIANCVGFEWDEGNLPKIWEKHKVSGAECEQIFFNHPLVAARDEKHSGEEDRYYALGHTCETTVKTVPKSVIEKCTTQTGSYSLLEGVAQWLTGRYAWTS